MRSKSDSDPGVRIEYNVAGEVFDLRDSSSAPVCVQVVKGGEAREVHITNLDGSPVAPPIVRLDVLKDRQLARQKVQEHLNPPAEGSGLRKLLNWFRRVDV